MIFYTLPSLLSLSLDRLLATGCPPASDIEPLPPHLKDALRRVLLKRGALTGGELGCLLHPGVQDLDLSDCDISYQHLAALTRCTHLRKLCLSQSYQDPSEEDLPGCSRVLGKVLMRNPRLEFLNLRKVLFVRDLTLSCLPASLTHLDLGGCRGLTDGGVRRLTSNCPRLASLSLSNTAVTDRSLLTISLSRGRDTVRDLRINGCVNITDTGIEALLSASTALQVFIFHGCPGVTERSRHCLETFLANTGQNVRQVTWTVY